MRYEHVVIEALAVVEAPHAITSRALEDALAPAASRLGLQPGTIEVLTGVKARRLWDPGVMPSEVAALAAERALAMTSLPRERVMMLINTSVSKDFIEPSVASAVHARLGLSERCVSFDLGNACLAFLNGMELVAGMIERGQLDAALIVAGESSRQVVESTLGRLLEPQSGAAQLREDFATLTLGSGAAAALLCRDDLATQGHHFRGGVSLAAPEWNHLCRGYEDRMITDASQLLKAGVALAKRTFGVAVESMGWSPDSLDALIMHQVGSIHMATILDALDLPRDRAFVTYADYGNIGPVAIPFTLARAAEAHHVRPGQRVALMGIGSGLNCAMMEVTW